MSTDNSINTNNKNSQNTSSNINISVRYQKSSCFSCSTSFTPSVSATYLLLHRCLAPCFKYERNLNYGIVGD